MKTGPRPLTKLQAWNKLLSKKQVTDTNCWLITDGYSVGIGYKKIRADGKDWYAHRLAYHMCCAEITSEVIMHSCDNPNCIQPEHLFDGTHADNVADKVAKRRHCFGEGHYKSKLTWEQVNEMRALRARHGYNLQFFADRYGVGRGTVQQILENKTWKI